MHKATENPQKPEKQQNHVPIVSCNTQYARHTICIKNMHTLQSMPTLCITLTFPATSKWCGNRAPSKIVCVNSLYVALLQSSRVQHTSKYEVSYHSTDGVAYVFFPPPCAGTASILCTYVGENIRHIHTYTYSPRHPKQPSQKAGHATFTHTLYSKLPNLFNLQAYWRVKPLHRVPNEY